MSHNFGQSKDFETKEKDYMNTCIVFHWKLHSKHHIDQKYPKHVLGTSPSLACHPPELGHEIDP